MTSQSLRLLSHGKTTSTDHAHRGNGFTSRPVLHGLPIRDQTYTYCASRILPFAVGPTVAAVAWFRIADDATLRPHRRGSVEGRVMDEQGDVHQCVSEETLAAICRAISSTALEHARRHIECYVRCLAVAARGMTPDAPAVVNPFTTTDLPSSIRLEAGFFASGRFTLSHRSLRPKTTLRGTFADQREESCCQAVCRAAGLIRYGRGLGRRHR